jgi:hypothetical protein
MINSARPVKDDGKNNFYLPLSIIVFGISYCLPSLLPYSFPVPLICATHHLSIYQQMCTEFTLTYSYLFSQFPSLAKNSKDNTSIEPYHSPTGTLLHHISLNINALNLLSSYVTKYSAVMLTKAQIPHFTVCATAHLIIIQKQVYKFQAPILIL